jgi:hypothetical protein
MHNRFNGPFFFSEKTINSDVYLNLLREFVVPQLERLQPTIIFQQDGAPPHWGQAVASFSAKHFQTGGLEEEEQFSGHHVLPISLPWASSYGDMLKISLYE